MKSNDVEEGKIIAGLIYLVSLIGVVGWVIAVVLFVLKKDNEYVTYHFQQWLILTIVGVIAMIISALTIFIVVGFVLLPVVAITLLVLWIIGMINAFTGKQKPLPLVGKWGEKLKLKA